MNLLGRPVRGTVRINLEGLLYALLALLAIAAAFVNLGARGQSHDECVHFIFSYELYSGDGFVHDPWRHGPFLYYASALMFALFGTSDWSARAVPALFGVILVLLPAFLRKELGRVGALSASALTLISPSTLYYARYLRNDIYMMVWALLMAVALLRFLDTRKAGWLYLGAVAVTMALATKETAYITGFIGAAFGGMLILRQALSARGTRTA
ncbi:MAG: TIGR03663 family protein [Anaerolineae bacterium]|nr:MAG: TIGR03663 family protein [Anaerolineae bacterium]